MSVKSRLTSALVRVASENQLTLRRTVAEQMTAEFVNEIKAALREDGKLSLPGLGIFRVDLSKERLIPSRPGSKEMVTLAPRKQLKFKTSKTIQPEVQEFAVHVSARGSKDDE